MEKRTEKSDLIDKIESIDNLTDSQQDHMTIQDKAFINLLGFLETQIKRVNSKNELKSEVERELLDRVVDSENIISTTALIKILEMLNKHEDDSANGVLTVLKEKVKIEINNTSSKTPERKEGVSEFTKEEIQNAKKFLTTLNQVNQIDDIIQGEFSEEELKNT